MRWLVSHLLSPEDLGGGRRNAPQGARGGLVTLVMGRWEARGGSRAGPGLERKSDPSPFGDLPSIRLVSTGST